MSDKSSKRGPVAQYLATKLKLSGKPISQVAAACGWADSKVLEMLLAGTSKVPVNKVGVLARELGVHPPYLLRLVLYEYMPETWEAIVDILEGGALSDHEREILEAYRELSGGKEMAVLLAPAYPVASVYPAKGAEFW